MTSWNSSEEDKISRVVERLVSSYRQMATSSSQQPGDRAIEEQEASELRLIMNAIGSKDVIGLVSLCGVFWSTRNQLRRDLSTAQKQRTTAQVVDAIAEDLLRRCGRDDGSSLLSEHVNALRSQNFELLANYSLLLHQQYAQLYQRVYGSNSNVDEMHRVHRIVSGESSSAVSVARSANQDRWGGSRAGAVVDPAAGSCAALDDDTALRLEAIRQFARSSLDAAAARNAEIRQSVATMEACVNAQKGNQTRTAVEALALAAQQADGASLKAAGSVTAVVPASLPDGSIPWALVRFVPLEALPGQSVLDVLQRCYGAEDLSEAERDPASIFSVNTGRIVVNIGRDASTPMNSSSGEQPVTSGTTIDSTFLRRTLVLVRVLHRIRGMTGALDNIDKRLVDIRSSLLPVAIEAVNIAREELWETEVGRLQDVSGLVLNSQEAQQAADSLKQAKKKLAAAECRVQHLEEAVRLCVAHRNALERSNIGALSSMVESRAFELMTDDDPTSPTGSMRLVYVCKELPVGHTIDTFAAAFGVPKESLQVFEDHFADLSPVSKTRKRTVKRMVYVPTHVPRPSLSTIDEELRFEMDEYQRQFPSFPPNTEIAEQLAAVRKGDVATLSTMVTNARKRMQKFEETTELAALKNQIVELQGALREQRLKADQLVASSKSLENDLQAVHDNNGNQLDSLRVQLAEAESKLERADGALKAERQSKSTESSSRERELLELRSRVVQLEARLREATAERSALEDSASKFSAERDAAARRAQQLEQQAHGVEEILTEERHSTHAAALMNTQLKQQVSTLQECLEVQNDEIARVRRELKRYNDSAVSAAEEISRLQRQVDEVKETKDVLVSQNQKLASQLNSANANLVSLRKEQQSTRETFIAKEIPAGRTAEEFAASLGVASDVAVPFFDSAVGKHYLYFPVQTGRLSAADEDRRLRQELQAVQNVGTGNGDVVAQLLDQLAALRSGDSVALSKMVSDLRGKALAAGTALAQVQTELRERVAELASLQLARGGGLSPSRGSTTTIDDESEDLAWFSAEVGKKKIILLREKIQTIARERDDWQQLCDEYRQRAAEFESLESAKADFLKRQAAHALMADTTTRELKDVSDRLRAAEEGRAKDLENFSINRRRLVSEQQAALEEMEAHVTSIKNHAAAEALNARRQAEHDRDLISKLTAALREHGIVVEKIDE